MKNLDLKDKKTLTIIIISFIVLFAIIYLWQNRKNNNTKVNEVKEGFEQYNVTGTDTVFLDSLDNVIVGYSGEGANRNPVFFTSKLNQLIDDRNSTSVNTIYARSVDLATTNANLASNAAILMATKTLAESINNNITTQVNEIQTNVNNNVSRLREVANNAMPALSITTFFGNTPPAGWQICDGAPLMSAEETPKNIIDTLGNNVNTPNLIGRFILGAIPSNNPREALDNSKITKRAPGKWGGAEQHTLTTAEMPAHRHQVKIFNGGATPGIAADGRNYGWPTNNDPPLEGGPIQATGGSQPHNNMPPYYSLIYIIKRPLVGGSNNPIQPINITESSG